MTREVRNRDREKIFDAVRGVIHEWDPYECAEPMWVVLSSSFSLSAALSSNLKIEL